MFQTALAAAPSQLCFQRIQWLLPEGSEVIEPLVHFPKRNFADRVQPARSLRPYRRKTGVAQHAEVLGHSRLRDSELCLDHGAQRARALFTLGQQFQDPAPDRVTKNVEGMHTPTISALAYISRD